MTPDAIASRPLTSGERKALWGLFDAVTGESVPRPRRWIFELADAMDISHRDARGEWRRYCRVRDRSHKRMNRGR